MNDEPLFTPDDIKVLSDMAQYIDNAAMAKAADADGDVTTYDLAVIGLAAGAVKHRMELLCAADGEEVPDVFQRYCVVSDDDGHSYYIPYDKIDTWGDWLESISEGGDAEEPDWATRIDGGTLTFTAPALK